MPGPLVKTCFLLAASVALLAQGPPTLAQTALPSAATSSTSSTPDEVPLQVIVVRSNEEAQQILERLENGEDFATLAKEKSIDPTASAGGYMGKFAPGELRAELRDALQGMAPGQVSKVARIPEGYAILKIMGGAPARQEWRPRGDAGLGRPGERQADAFGVWTAGGRGGSAAVSQAGRLGA